MAVRALVFDLWGTLIEGTVIQEEPRWSVRTRLVREALDLHGASFEDEAINAALHGFVAELNAVQAQGLDLAPPERLERVLQRLDPGLIERLSHEGLRAVDDAVTSAIRASPAAAMAGAREVLDETKRRGLRLGLVSNTGLTTGYALRELLGGLGLREQLEVMTFSDEACLAKPAEAIFRCTLEALEVEPKDAVFIGDTPELDIAGPRAVGMWTVQIGNRQADGVAPDARIDALPELFAALGGLGLLA